MNKNSFINKKGFSLIELTIGVLLLSILMSAVVPNFVMGIRQEAAKKTAVEMLQIQEAARKYYVDKGSWPADFPTLAAGYLDPTWSATNLNPFGNPYSVSILSPNLIVQTNIPTDVYQVAGANLQMVNYLTVTGQPVETVQSTITPPGSLSTLLVGSIIPWPSSSLPNGFLWCNGQNVSRTAYSGLFAVIGTIYGIGDGSTTFSLPDTMGRTIVGQDAMGGVSAANRITQWGTLPGTLGATFGEDAHRQTWAQMAPHSHSFASWDYVKGFSGNSTTSPRDPQGGTTGSAGGNGDGTGLGAPSNVVQPSIAMGYIIKT